MTTKPKRTIRKAATASEQIAQMHEVKRGRPSSYTPEIATYICSEIALGRSLRSICSSDADTPHIGTVIEWLERHPAFAEQYARARESRADARADRIDEITECVLADKLDPRAAQVAIDALKWQAGKEQPKRYGDTMRVEATLAASVTVGALAAGRRRVQAEEAAKLIEGDVVDSDPVQ